MGWRKGKWVSPVHPDFSKMTREAIVKHYIKEERKWVHGHDGLPGPYFKYLSEYKIQDRYEGQVIRPAYRQADHEMIFPWLSKVIDNSRDGIWLSSRGSGKSTIICGPAVMETAMNYPGSQVLITADSLTNIQTNFEGKLKACYNGLSPFLRPKMSGTWPSVSGKNMPVIQFIKKFRQNGVYVEEGLGSIIRGIDTVSKGEGNKVEGQGSKLFVIDEMFKNPNVESLYSKSVALTKRGRVKVGSILFVGSCSDAEAKGLKAAEDLWNNAPTLGIEPLFVPATHLFEEYEKYTDEGVLTGDYVKVLDSTGNIDPQKAYECIMRNRDALYKLPSKRKYYEEILQYPITVDEIFEANRENWWSMETVEQVKIQKNSVFISIGASNFEKCDRPAMIFENPVTRLPEFTYLENREYAEVFVVRDAEPNVKYGMGTDPIFQNTSNDKGSDTVSSVKSFDQNMYSCYLAKRDYGVRDTVKKQILLQRKYNNCENLVEANAIGAQLTLYTEWGMRHLLAKTPRRFRTKTGVADYGLFKDRNATSLHELVRQYVEDNVHLIQIERFFHEFMKFPLENADMLDSWAMTEALHEEYRNLGKRQAVGPELPELTLEYVDIGGKRVMMVNGSNGHIGSGGELNLMNIFKNASKT